MSFVENINWEALPARKRKTDKIEQPMVGRKLVASHQQILDNIEARKCRQNHDISTLLSRDGCAGANYECKK